MRKYSTFLLEYIFKREISHKGAYLLIRPNFSDFAFCKFVIFSKNLTFFLKILVIMRFLGLFWCKLYSPKFFIHSLINHFITTSALIDTPFTISSDNLHKICLDRQWKTPILLTHEQWINGTAERTRLRDIRHSKRLVKPSG